MRTENLVTVRQLSASSPAFSEASIRWMIFCAERNGLDRALVKVGRRILIDVPEFERWLESHRLGDVETVPADGIK